MAERILIVDDDVDTLRLVGLMLQRQGYQVIAASNGSQGLTKAFEERPDLILLDVMMPDMDGYEVTRRLRKNPATAAIPVLMFTAKTQLDDKVAGFEVGADDYLTKPTHPTELQSHVKALLARAIPKRPEDMETVYREKNGYVIGVLSVRGGLGVSTVAANLAAGLYTRSKADVVLAELTPGQGSIAFEFGLSSQNGLSDILKGKSIEITREKIQSALVPHNMGARILAASDSPRDIDLMNHADNFETLILRLGGLARFIVLDLGSGLAASVQKSLSLCSDRIVVLEGTASSIHQTKILLSEMAESGIDTKTISVVLNNRQRSDAQIPWAQVQERLGHPIVTSLTPASELFMQASKLNTPALVAQPEHMVSQQFLKLADAIIEREKAR